MKHTRSIRWNIAKQMPPLSHSVPGQDFDIQKSEAAQWLCSQPEIMQLIFGAAKDHGDIAYDPDTRTWQGVDYGN